MHQLHLATANVEDDLVKPSAELAESIAAETAAALNKVRESKASASKLSLAIESIKRNDKYVRYIPDEAAPGYNPVCAERVIRLVERQVDPLEPARFKSRRAPHAKTEEPAPLERAPPKKLTPEDQAAWKIPPCISNWKNQQGYTIPLDMRLQADGRGLQEVTVNSGFAQFSEALYVAERLAREEIRMKNDLVKQKKQLEEAEREERLREIAAKARAERSQLLQGQSLVEKEEEKEKDSESASSHSRRRSPSPRDRQPRRDEKVSRRLDDGSVSPPKRRRSPSPDRRNLRRIGSQSHHGRNDSNPANRLQRDRSVSLEQVDCARSRRRIPECKSESESDEEKDGSSEGRHRRSTTSLRTRGSCVGKARHGHEMSHPSSRPTRGRRENQSEGSSPSMSPPRRRLSPSPRQTRARVQRSPSPLQTRAKGRRSPSPSPLKTRAKGRRSPSPSPLKTRAKGRRPSSPSPLKTRAEGRRPSSPSPVHTRAKGRRPSSPSPLQTRAKGRRSPSPSPLKTRAFHRRSPSPSPLKTRAHGRRSSSPSPVQEARGQRPSPSFSRRNTRGRRSSSSSPMKTQAHDRRSLSPSSVNSRNLARERSDSPRSKIQSGFQKRPASPSPPRQRQRLGSEREDERGMRDGGQHLRIRSVRSTGSRSPRRRHSPHRRRQSPSSASDDGNRRRPVMRLSEPMGRLGRREGGRRRQRSRSKERDSSVQMSREAERSKSGSDGEREEKRRRPIDALEEVERERRREIERELRLERAGAKRRRLVDDKDRDISEKVALGQAQTTMQEDLFDARLFNRETAAAADITVADDDEYALYDKPLFADRSKAKRFL